MCCSFEKCRNWRLNLGFPTWDSRTRKPEFYIIIIRSRRQVRCVNPEWPRRRALDHSARMLKGVPSPICWIHVWGGRPVLTVAANQDQSRGQLLLLRPVIMRGGLVCGHRVSPHGRTMNFISWRWYPEHREGWYGRQRFTLSKKRVFGAEHWAVFESN